MSAVATRQDVYTRVTSTIISFLEQGVKPWFRPWNAQHAAGSPSRPLRCTGEAYQGINVLMLWAASVEAGFACPLWLTFNQAKQLGGSIKKGAKASLVVYASSFKKEQVGNAGEVFEQEIPFLKGYYVFNAEQTEGLPAHYYALKEQKQDLQARLEHADRFFNNTHAEIQHGGNQAFYAPERDIIQMPTYQSFRDRESYYATLAHEATHWTKHSTRLDRDLGKKRFGDAGYAMEELVAELGSAYLSADLGITLSPREDHASYIENWLSVLKNDRKAIFSAASFAEQAVHYLHTLQTERN